MSPLMRKIFKILNKYFMVPIFRLGLGWFFGNPINGYIMVMKAIGRKSGKLRYAPVNYAIYKGDVYCVSGGRESSDWYRNLMANPEIDVILPGGTIHGKIKEITDEKDRLLIIRQIFQNAGFAGFFEGYNPWKITDEELVEKIGDLPLLRIRPTGIGSGPADASGWVWVWSVVFFLVLVLILVLK
jgi:deazaflavin-dependent oxidoreductase (nitroreductase family)